MNIYLELTRKFNSGRVRAILAGGQAVVLHRLARQMEGLDLFEAHQLMVQRARTLLPFIVPGGWP